MENVAILPICIVGNMRPTLTWGLPEADNLPFAIVSSILVSVMVSQSEACVHMKIREKKTSLEFHF